MPLEERFTVVGYPLAAGHVARLGKNEGGEVAVLQGECSPFEYMRRVRGRWLQKGV